MSDDATPRPWGIKEQDGRFVAGAAEPTTTFFRDGTASVYFSERELEHLCTAVNAIDQLRAENAALREALLPLYMAVDDAMESPEEAASWAETGDMRGYLNKASRVLELTAPDHISEDVLPKVKLRDAFLIVYDFAEEHGFNRKGNLEDVAKVADVLARIPGSATDSDSGTCPQCGERHGVHRGDHQFEIPATDSGTEKVCACGHPAFDACNPTDAHTGGEDG